MQVQKWTNFWNPVQFAESAYICGFRLQILRIPLTFTDSSNILRIHLQVRNSDN